MDNAPDEFLCDGSGEPLRVFHGTPCDYDDFDLDRHHTVGIHFGCLTQARARLCECDTGWIIAANIRKGRLLEIRSPISGQLVDAFSESPSLTAFYLSNRSILDPDDMAALGFSGLTLPAASRMEWNSGTRRSKNHDLMQRLKRHADIIRYGNRNEPRDGTTREAYCLLSTEHIFKIDKTKWHK